MTTLPSQTPALVLRDMEVSYGAMRVLQDVNVEVGEGETVALLGHNGAGKSTLLRAIYGLVPLGGGQVLLHGVDIDGAHPADRIAAGLAYVPQHEEIFRDLTVRENLVLSLVSQRTTRPVIEAAISEAASVFPFLGGCLAEQAGTLSGGQRRVLGLAMALIRHPTVLLLDEPSAGLSPLAVDELYQYLTAVQRERTLTVLLAEQNVMQAAGWTERTVILRTGRVSWAGSSRELAGKATVEIARLL